MNRDAGGAVNLCQCGCGAPVRNRFLRGHFRRGKAPMAETRRRQAGEIIARIQAGERFEVVAEFIGITTAYARHLYYTNGGPKLGGSRRIRMGEAAWGTEQRNEEIRKLFEKGEPMSEIAARFGVSRQRVEQLIHPAKQRARDAANRALARGGLTRSDHCQLCGARGSVEAHHPRYDNPTSVTWLCRDCHIVGDMRRRRIESNSGREIPNTEVAA